jgi:hypothetical protein
MSSTQMVPQFTPAGRKFISFLGTYNSGGSEAIFRFVAENYAHSLLERQGAELRATWLVSYFQQTGRLSVRRFEQDSEYEIAVYAASSVTGGEVFVQVKVDTAPPHLITEFSIR